MTTEKEKQEYTKAITGIPETPPRSSLAPPFLLPPDLPCPLLLVAERLVSLVHLLEFIRRPLFLADVRVPAQCQFPIGLLDLLRAGGKRTRERKGAVREETGRSYPTNAL